MGEGLWFSATLKLKEGSKANLDGLKSDIDWLTFVQSNQLGKLQRKSLENKSQKRLQYSKINEDEHSRIYLGLKALNSLWFTLPGPLKAWRMKRLGKVEEIDRSRLTSVFEQEGDWSRFVILSIPVGTTGWKGAIALPFGNIRTLILIMMVIHTCLADLLLKA